MAVLDREAPAGAAAGGGGADHQDRSASTGNTIIPRELRTLRRWITWDFDQHGGKRPLVRWSDPETWMTYDEARGRGPRVGIVLGELDDGGRLGGVDLDACRDPETCVLTEWARDFVREFGSYAEVSPSGTGVKIFALGAVPKLPASVLPMEGASIDGKRPQVEAYVDGRWFAVTGDKLPDAPAEVRGSAAWVKLFHRLDERAKAGGAGGGVARPAAGRNDALYRHLCGLRAKGWSEDAIRAAAEAENRNPSSEFHANFADGSLDARELDQIIKSVMKRPAGTALAERGLSLTDAGNGGRLVAHHGDDLLYCHPWRTWLVWDGRRFRPDDNGEIVRRAKATAAAIYEEAAASAASDDQRAKAVAKHAASSQSRPRLEAMEWAARSELPVAVDELDADPELLNLENGTLDLRTLTLREHRREDKLTKLAPFALDGEAACPTWATFLDRIFAGDAELIEFVQRAIGYTLTGNVGEHVFFLLHGTGANGKTTLVKTLEAMLGDYARTVRVEALLASDRSRAGAPNEDVANLIGVRLASTSEPDEQFRLNEALIKSLTGGDTISARRLFGQLFEFQPTHKLWFAANHKPEIRGVDEGIWRRVMFVPFEVTIPKDERDPTLPDKLRGELPGILSWAVDGLRAYRDRGLDPPDKVRAATDEYREEQDILADFLVAECEIGGDHFAVTAQLTSAYEAFAGGEAVRPKTFAKLLTARGFRRGVRKVDGRAVRVWEGLNLLRPAPMDYDERNPPPDDLPF